MIIKNKYIKPLYQLSYREYILFRKQGHNIAEYIGFNEDDLKNVSIYRWNKIKDYLKTECFAKYKPELIDEFILDDKRYFTNKLDLSTVGKYNLFTTFQRETSDEYELYPIIIAIAITDKIDYNEVKEISKKVSELNWSLVMDLSNFFFIKLNLLLKQENKYWKRWKLLYLSAKVSLTSSYNKTLLKLKLILASSMTTYLLWKLQRRLMIPTQTSKKETT